ncbi:TDP-N-acetylfucosamine:lipid II N-acetylfucosaminyltransferase [uncultured Croceitalea sp.]|uniref:TDP-N-acetylfucosamine:lipid II N-acetylfucosaminyltransferase n=1 Tax=uncultured Croceitalea sp. TaxID=1798908 RepID=UPI00374F7A52
MIVHLFDDEKFVDSTIETFETVGAGKNKYIVFSNSKELKHPKNLKLIEILPNNYRKLDLDTIYDNCDVLAIHYLTPIKTHLLKRKPQHVKVVWMVWGKDAYDYFGSFQQYEELTKRVLRNSFKTFLKKSFLYNAFHYLKYGVSTINKERKALNNLNYLATVIPPEFEVIKNEFKLHVEPIKFSYDSLTPVLLNDNEIVLGKDILIGNSATPPNNHLDIFHKIKNKVRVIVPLNYGDMNYAKEIERKGHEIFENRFIPIKDFMTFDAYIELVFSCNTMIMYHIRQQGLGNILLALFGGMRVFLNNKSPLYSYLKQLNFIVFDLDKDTALAGLELNLEEKKMNKEKVREHWGAENILEGARDIMRIHDKTSD